MTTTTTEQLVQMMRERSCPAGLPWTMEDPVSDHGHTDCWLYHAAALAIEVLENSLSEAGRQMAVAESEIDRLQTIIAHLMDILEPEGA